MNNAAMNIGVHVSLQIRVFLDIYLGVGLHDVVIVQKHRTLVVKKQKHK